MSDLTALYKALPANLVSYGRQVNRRKLARFVRDALREDGYLIVKHHPNPDAKVAWMLPPQPAPPLVIDTDGWPDE